MGLVSVAYRRYLLPHLVHRACRGAPMARQRELVVPMAEGDVLEVGMGSALNLPFYDPARVRRLWGLDPAEEMAPWATAAAGGAPFPVELIRARGEEIPLASRSADTVVLTYTLCTVADPLTALREVARVLRPHGRLLFCEHGVAPDPGVRRWQELLNPAWRRLSGGCHLQRDIPGLLRDGGFRLGSLETGYIRVWRPAGFNYWGWAVPR